MHLQLAYILHKGRVVDGCSSSSQGRVVDGCSSSSNDIGWL